MNEQKQRIVIAKACGIKVVRFDQVVPSNKQTVPFAMHYDNKLHHVENVPDYFHNLNDTFTFVSVLIQKGFRFELLSSDNGLFVANFSGVKLFQAVGDDLATVICNAGLLALNKWEDG